VLIDGMRAPRPRTRRGALLTLGGGIVVLAVAAFVFVYFVLFPTSSPKPFSIASSPATTAAATPPGSRSGLAGRWTIASGSRAGYRVREKLGFLPAESDAVGRTSQITGGATLTESHGSVSVSGASFVVAVNTLKSDQAQRDQHIQTIGLQSATYPKATFTLSSPIKLPAATLTGGVVHDAVTGVFDIHGVSRRLTVPLEMRVSSSALEAVGSLTFPWSEFGMTAPSVGGFVNVSNAATMEFDLRLARA
jgi:polyisoprenoid-binding protein YceI